VRFTCTLHAGLHARPASMLAEVVRGRDASLTLAKAEGTPVDAGSVLSIVGLDVKLGDPCVLKASGPDSPAVIAAARELIDFAWAKAEQAQPEVPGVVAGPRQIPLSLQVHKPRLVSGVPACRGVGSGVAVVVGGLVLSPTLISATPKTPQAEQEAATRALDALAADLKDRAERAAKPLERELLRAHYGIATDPALRAEISVQIRAGKTAPQAVVAAGSKFMETLRGAATAYIRDRIVDIQDICMQSLDRLGATGDATRQIRLERNSVVVAEVLTPNQLMKLDHAKLKGLVLGAVGITSHTVILARSLGVPTIIDARGALQLIKPGDEVIVDGHRGVAAIASDAGVQRFYQLVERAQQRRREKLAPVIGRAASTKDGIRVEIAANASTPSEANHAVAQGGEGVGLLRTELLFLDRADPPSEEEQYHAYAGVVDACKGRPVIIRTLDIGGDKPAAYMSIPGEDNPFLGCRGIRLYPQYHALLRSQLRAILRASAKGPVKVMAPMVATVSEASWFRDQVRGVQAELRAEGVAFDEKMPIGVMVEVPAVSLVIDELGEVVDFLSVGTNDLCQYWMAVDRGNKAVSSLYSARQPSFLRLLSGIVRAARAKGVWIGVCGEMASDRLHLPLLVAMGVNEISVAPSEILTLKAALANLDSKACQEVLAAALACRTPEEVTNLLRSKGGASSGGGVIEPNAIVCGSDAASKHEAIREGVDAISVSGRTEDPDAIERAIWAREETYSTGLGYGFAIPHCKTEGVTEATLAVVKLTTPIEWGSNDGQPVDIMLMLAVPAADTAGTHMKVFAKLARKLMHESFRSRLRDAADPNTILKTLEEELQL